MNTTTTATHLQAASTATSAQRANWPRRIVYRIVGVMAALLMAVTGTLVSAGAAQAGIVPTLGVYCGGGQVAATSLVFANRGILTNGQSVGQYVSLRFYASDVYGRSQFSAWSDPVFAPVGGGGVGMTIMSTFATPGWGMTHVQAQAAFWDGRQWSYDRDWTSLKRCYPNKGIY